MGFLCNHGYFRGDCLECSEYRDEMETLSFLDEESDWYDYLQDYYLERDERELRNDEEHVDN